MGNRLIKLKPDYYFYRKSIIRWLFTIIDYFGFLFFNQKPLIKVSENKILLINLGGAGDLIISEPLLSALSDFSGKKIDLVCCPNQEKALLNLPLIGKVFNCKLSWLGGGNGQRQLLINCFKLIKILRQEKYSVAIDIKGDPIIILLMFISKIPLRVGFSNGGLGFLLTHPLSQPLNLKRFKVDLSLLDAFDVKNKEYNREPYLPLFLARPQASGPIKNIAVHLGASVQARQWPIEYWAKLFNLLKIKYQIAIIGAPEDFEKLFSLAPELINSCDDCSGQSWSETAAAINRADVFIGANSGPAHLAAAIGCRIISIFSAANNPDVWAPPGAKVCIFKPDCYGCELKYCAPLSCLKAITPQIVYDYLSELDKA